MKYVPSEKGVKILRQREDVKMEKFGDKSVVPMRDFWYSIGYVKGV